MLHILDTSSKRIIQILLILLDSNNLSSVKILSNQLNVSEKTILEDLKRIKESWEEKIELNITSEGSVSSKKLNVNNFLDLQSLILLKSIPIKFLILLFYNPFNDLTYYAEQLHVSRSTLYRYVNQINDYLKSYSISIKKEHSVYFLYSDREMSLRRFFTTMFLEISGFHSESFISDEHLFFLSQRIKTNYHFNKESLSDLQTHFYVVLYFVSLKRELQGFYLNFSYLFSGKILPLEKLDSTTYAKIYQELTEEDVYRIEKSILIFRHSLNSTSDSHLTETMPNFLCHIFDRFSLETNQEIFDLLLDYIKDLYISEKYTDIPFHLINNRFTYFSKEVEIDNPHVFDIIKQEVQKLSQLTEVDFDRDFDYVLYILITLLPDIMLLRVKKRILFVSDYSKEHAHFLLKLVQNHLNIDPIYFSQAEYIKKETIKDIELSNYDLVFSNTTINYNDFISINDFPTDEDIQCIKQLILR